MQIKEILISNRFNFLGKCITNELYSVEQFLQYSNLFRNLFTLGLALGPLFVLLFQGIPVLLFYLDAFLHLSAFLDFLFITVTALTL